MIEKIQNKIAPIFGISLLNNNHKNKKEKEQNKDKNKRMDFVEINKNPTIVDGNEDLKELLQLLRTTSQKRRLTNMNKCGVFIMRAQPLHNAHLYIINIALQECEKLVVVLGSANKKNMLRNPFDIETRKKMVLEALENKEDFKRIIFFELPDWSMESKQEDVKLWGRYLYYNIVSRAQAKYFTFYYSDDPKIMLSWFEDTEIFHYLTFRFLERNNMFDGLSATKIRQAIYDYDIEYIKKYCPQSVVDKIDELRSIWLKVQENYVEDYSL